MVGNKEIKVSACVIVRNEAENLPRWLTCMKELANELVVVDTGSEDNTVALAEAAGARVFSFPWINDFGKAKNYAIEQARGRWIIFLDADEYWEPKDYGIVKQILQRYDKQEKIIGFVCRRLNIDKDNGNRVQNENLYIRIFRNLPKLRYVGAVHEQLVYHGEGQKEMTLLPDAVIYHTGYSASTDESKSRRNLDILLAQQAAGNGSDWDLCYIADCYYSLKDYARAADYARMAIKKKVILPGRETRMYSTLLQCQSILGDHWREMLPLLQEAEQEFPYVPDFRAILGFAAWQQGDREDAKHLFVQSKEIYQEFLAHRGDATASYTDEMLGFLPQIEALLVEDSVQEKINYKISAAVIVKNEEENLPIWLECMLHLAEEIIVVDTGSTDRTVEIAQNAGARVVHFDWIDDFAAAKNFAIDQTHGEWILLLDADEYIRPEDYAGVRRAIDRYDKDSSVIGLACDWINVDKDRNNACISKGYQIRVFRKLPELRYIRMIHENLQYTGTENTSMPLVKDFRIYHTGYSTVRMPEKLRRNLRLLQLSAEKYGRSVMDEMYLADCYYGLKEYEQAIIHARAYVEMMADSEAAENRPYTILIQSLFLLEHPLEEITAVIRQALEKFPYMADFKIMEGYFREDKGDYIGAEECYLEAERMYAYAQEHDLLRQRLLTDEVGSDMSVMYANLSRLFFWQGKDLEAWDYLQKSLAVNKYCHKAFILLLKFLAGRTDVEWIEAINSIYDREQDAEFLLEKLPRQNRDKVRLYYQQRLKTEVKPAESYMLAGRLEAAGAAVTEDVSALWQMGIRGLSHGDSAMQKLGGLMPTAYRSVITGQLKTLAERRLARRTERIQSWLEEQDG
ncbi:Glycosyltransferase involved in cell wall bisynthesis [Selenomonas ruminantium]|uniref:Glycosyltransferase involved in cell wall bisynthesis n=1 Tax=Selenomonas ruminantium TaxID=971 RepID=A0A1M6UM23_SELRU|nr:glycosyltransferase family 2 protein [Selenomonas ruminantium]SHK70226.1 Glycosyltransferase involved in cell wall bisynthesis [Selenomonas ruminantium]